MHDDQLQGGARKSAPRRKRDWRKLHHSPIFWVGAVIFVAAIAFYVLAGGYAFVPKG